MWQKVKESMNYIMKNFEENFSLFREKYKHYTLLKLKTGFKF